MEINYWIEMWLKRFPTHDKRSAINLPECVNWCATRIYCKRLNKRCLRRRRRIRHGIAHRNRNTTQRQTRCNFRSPAARFHLPSAIKPTDYITLPIAIYKKEYIVVAHCEQVWTDWFLKLSVLISFPYNIPPHRRSLFRKYIHNTHKTI